MATYRTRTVPDSPERPFMTRPHITRERGEWVVYWITTPPMVELTVAAANWCVDTLGGPTRCRYGDPF